MGTRRGGGERKGESRKGKRRGKVWEGEGRKKKRG